MGRHENRTRAALQARSRPSSRRAGLAFADLRAIPWVFSWHQSRHGLPGWFGLGSALVQIALARADIDVAECYAAGRSGRARSLPAIRDEWHRTVGSVLAVAAAGGAVHHDQRDRGGPADRRLSVTAGSRP
jgi:phosphoenolpyruvate carboxylase